MAKIVCTCKTDDMKIVHTTISSGGVIIFPTDTVYGIGCSPYSKDAIERIYKIKNRSTDKPLPVLADSYKTLEKFCIFDQRHKNIAEKFWPGPVTMVVKLADENMSNAMNLDGTIAVRVPLGDCTQAVLTACGPLACTSANISGMSSTTNYSQCAKLDVDVGIDSGVVGGGMESTIIDTTRERLRILRNGPIQEKEINSIWQA